MFRYLRTILLSALSLASQWATAPAEPVVYQLEQSTTVKRFPPFYNMHGISAVETEGNDVYLTTSTVDMYHYYRCHPTYVSHKRLEISRLNATALKTVTGREGFAIVYDGLNCTGNARAFRDAESLCYANFPDNHHNVRNFWKSVSVPPKSTLRLDHRSCNGGNTYYYYYTDLQNDSPNRHRCFEKHVATAGKQYTHHMRFVNPPSTPKVYINRAIISSNYYDSVINVHAQGNVRVSTYVQKMKITEDAVYVLTFNRFRCNNFPSSLIKLTRDLQLVKLVEFNNIGTYNALDNTRYGVDMIVDEHTNGHITVVFSHFEEAPVALFNATTLDLIDYIVFEKPKREFQGDEDDQQEQQQEYVSSFTHALRVNASRTWLFTDDGQILVFNHMTAFSGGALRNASYTLVPFEEGVVTSVELKGDLVYVLISRRLFILDRHTAKVVHFNEQCGMRAKEFSADWSLSGPFVQHAYSGFGYLFPEEGSVQHIALRDMSAKRGDTLTIDKAFASYYWRYNNLNVGVAKNANVSAIATEANILVTGTNVNNIDFQPPLLIITHLEGCAAGRAGARCDPCRAGTYTGDDGMKECIACEPGRYNDRDESVTCQQCPLGFVAPDSNATECDECLFGEYADTQGGTQCKKCPVDTYHMQKKSQTAKDCLACAAGQIAAERGSSSCAHCPFGKYKSPKDVGTCSNCQPGKFKDTQSIGCKNCPQGRFAANNGTVTCAPCPPGSHTEEFMRKTCVLCGKGRFAVATHGDPEEACEACAVGFYNEDRGSADAQACEPCPAGKQAANSIPGATSPQVCLDCPEGRYGLGGNAVCEECPAGNIILKKGSETQSACEACSAGAFWIAADKPCVPCPKNTYQSFEGMVGLSSCIACAPGSIAPNRSNTKASDCLICPRGTYAEGTACTVCPVGKFLDAEGSTGASDCKPCAVGRYGENKGAADESLCTACPRGKEATNDEPGASVPLVCRECERGMFGLGSDNPCTSCKEGRVVLAKGAGSEADCEACPAGTYWVATDSACTVCPVNTYQSFEGMVGLSSCISCAPGSVAPNRSNTEASDCLVCPRGKYAEGTACSECPVGKFLDSEGSTDASACKPCAVGYYGENRGATDESMCTACPPGKEATNADPGASLPLVCRTCERGRFGLGSDNSCTSCKEGRVVLAKGAGSEADCEACPAGTFWVATDSACTVCPVNTYQSFEGMVGVSSCIACAPGSVAPNRSNTEASDCLVCPRGTYAEGTACTECPVGKFLDTEGSASLEECKPCAVGYYGENRGATDESMCTACPPGKEATNSDPGASVALVCRTCERGMFGLGSDNSCTSCKEGRVVLAKGAGSEADCEACPAGTFWVTTDSECTVCPVNTYQSFEGMTGKSSCIACASGSVAPKQGNTQASDCLVCPQGTYAEGTQCTSCPVGKFSDTERATTVDTCEDCPAGRYGAEEALVSEEKCSVCPRGKRGLKPGQSGEGEACGVCPENTFQDAEGREACTPCDAGYVNPNFGSVSADACIQCPTGYFTEISKCVACSEGRFSNTPNAKSNGVCAICPNGRYGSPEGANDPSLCKPCAAGRFGIEAAPRRIFMEEACETCPAGFISKSGKLECSACPAGTTSNAEGTVCRACPPGSYTDTEGSPGCFACPENRVSAKRGSVMCEPCNTNMQPNAAATACVCTKNVLSRNGGCEPCPGGATCNRPNTTVRTISLLPGFWREDPDSLDIRRCNEYHACAGGMVVNASSDSLCRQGHTGPLCHVCAPGFAKTKGLCAVCPKNQRGVNVFVTALAPLTAAVLLFGLIKTANPKDGEQRDAFSGISKIAASFAQVYSVCSNFEVKWPPVVESMFSATDYVNPSISFYSAQCAIGWGFFDKLWLYLLMPPIYIFFMTSALIGLSQKYGGREFIERWFATSIVVGLFLAYPTTVKALMRVLSCDKVGTKYYISTEYQIECYTQKHNVYSFLSGTALVLYGVGIPLGAFAVLWRYRNRLYEPLPQRLRFLFHGYRLYYWEFVVLARKVSILAMSVFLFRRQSVRYQTIVASWAIQAAMFVHLKFVPFDKQTAYGRLCDRLEWFGLVATTGTLNSGIVFGTPADDYELGLTENIILVMVMLINSAVFTAFAYHLFLSGMRKFFIKAGVLCGCIPAERPSPRTLSRHRQSMVGKFVYGSKEDDFEAELTAVTDTRVQIDDALRGQRQRGSRTDELERINVELADNYKDLKFTAHASEKIKDKLFRFVHENQTAENLELLDLFVAEQASHISELQQKLKDQRQSQLYDEAVTAAVRLLLNDVLEEIENNNAIVLNL